MIISDRLPDTELQYRIAISMIPGLGSITAKKVIAYSGGVEAVFRESKRILMKIPGIGDIIAGNIVNSHVLDEAAREVEYIRNNLIRACFYLDEDYPERLKQCADAPVMLYVKGEASLDEDKVISIVGTRSATWEGKEFCQKLAQQLAERGHRIVIVSGLAYGIDISAHKAALKNNIPTVAVLGHGLGTIYPASHRNVAGEMIRQGALVTDFTSGTKPERNNFIKRNRIIAGLSDATLVVESGVKGGALITADLAMSYDRDVFAVPGRISDDHSAGCNRLIKTNRAALIENIDDLEYFMNWSSGGQTRATQPGLFPNLCPEEENILEIIGQEMCTIDEIALKLDLPVSKVSPALLNMEFKGLLQQLPGKIYRRKN